MNVTNDVTSFWANKDNFPFSSVVQFIRVQLYPDTRCLECNEAMPSFCLAQLGEVIAEWGMMGLGCGRHAGEKQKKCEIAWKKVLKRLQKSVENGVKSSPFLVWTGFIRADAAEWIFHTPLHRVKWHPMRQVCNQCVSTLFLLLFYDVGIAGVKACYAS